MFKKIFYKRKKKKNKQFLKFLKQYFKNRFSSRNSSTTSLLSLFPLKYLINPAKKNIYRQSLSVVSQISFNKIINILMQHGKKSIIETHFFKLLLFFKFNSFYNFQHLWPTYVSITVPALGLRRVRKGSIYYNVPFILIPYHQVGLVLRWFKNAVILLKSKSLYICLFIESINLLFQRNVGVIKQKNLLHKQVLNNRAFSHFRWI